MSLVMPGAGSRGEDPAAAEEGAASTARRVARWVFLTGTALGLVSCATGDSKDGIVGAGAGEDRPAIRRDQHSYNQDDPNEVKVDLLQYKKSF